MARGVRFAKVMACSSRNASATTLTAIIAGLAIVWRKRSYATGPRATARTRSSSSTTNRATNTLDSSRNMKIMYERRRVHHNRGTRRR
jgi:hypothetical protein